MDITMDITELPEQEVHRLFELYREECQRRGLKGSLRDFVLWVKAR